MPRTKLTPEEKAARAAARRAKKKAAAAPVVQKEVEAVVAEEAAQESVAKEETPAATSTKPTKQPVVEFKGFARKPKSVSQVLEMWNKMSAEEKAHWEGSDQSLVTTGTGVMKQLDSTFTSTVMAGWVWVMVGTELCSVPVSRSEYLGAISVNVDMNTTTEE